VARSIGNQIPSTLWPVLDGSDVARWVGTTILLLTSTPDGWPHLAMVSMGEVLLLDSRRLLLALWPNSTATANLTHSGRATLALVHGQAGYYVRAATLRGEDLAVPDAGSYACFSLQVADVQEDVAPYATLTGGVTYVLKDPIDTVERWQRTVRGLRQRAALA
jgi:hypothetical protein